jgi:NADH-ubiquinone oxidoreductase chain 5
MILFIGWEGVGLISYLLIHFWHTRLLANYSAFKAFLINRIGDTGLSLALLML